MLNRSLAFWSLVSIVLLSQLTISTPAQAADKPNILVIMLDDLDLVVTGPYYKHFIPKIWSLRDEGINFENFFITTPTCCPSRSSLLSGLYSHNTGVYANRGIYGGRQRFLEEENSTLPIFLKKAGYQTFILGKYLNGYKPGELGGRLPGWDYANISASPKSSKNYGPYGYTLAEWTPTQDVEYYEYNKATENYSSDVIFDRAEELVKETGSKGAPFFGYISPSCPHIPLPPAPRHVEKTYELNDQFPLPTDRPNYYNKKATKSKASWLGKGKFIGIRKRNGGVAWKIKGGLTLRGTIFGGFNETDWLNRIGALLTCDERVSQLIDQLKNDGLWDNTYVIVMSDNGYMLGAHTLSQKTVPYEESIRVPMIVTGGKVASSSGSKAKEWGTNIDLTPTILDLAQIKYDPNQFDGESLAGHITPSSTAVPQRRHSFFEYLGSTGEKPRKKWGRIKKRMAIPYYQSVRSKVNVDGKELIYKLVRWERWGNKALPVRDFEYELYNISSDPYEILNLVDADEPLRTELFDQLDGLLDKFDQCQGASCQDLNY